MRELLESPTFQAWLVSARQRKPFQTQFEGSESHLDEYLQFRVQRVINQLTYEQKMSLYQATNEIIKANKAEQRANANG